LAKLAPVEAAWRGVLGESVVVGPFLGNDVWRRASETWADPDLSDDELVLDIADRLVDYIVCFEPALRS
jgi:myo-inositol catabolism protein IolC